MADDAAKEKANIVYHVNIWSIINYIMATNLKGLEKKSRTSLAKESLMS